MNRDGYKKILESYDGHGVSYNGQIPHPDEFSCLDERCDTRQLRKCFELNSEVDEELKKDGVIVCSQVRQVGNKKPQNRITDIRGQRKKKGGGELTNKTATDKRLNR